MEIYVDEFALTPKRFIAGTRGSYGFCTMCFRFGAEWDGLAKKVTFYPLDGSDPVYLIVSDDKVEIPQEIMRCAGVNRYVVSGCKNEDVLISITGEIDVLDSLSPDGVNAEEPTPTQMEQVMTMMQRAVDVAQSVRDDADKGVFDGEKGDAGEKGEQGEKGERGEKGEKGDTGEVTLDYANNTYANALKGTASGEAIAITDVSPIEHEMDVKVRGKNLINMSAVTIPSGQSYSYENGIATISQGTYVYVPRARWDFFDVSMFEGKTVTVSLDVTEDHGTNTKGNILYIQGISDKEYNLKPHGFTQTGKITLTYTFADKLDYDQIRIMLYAQHLKDASESLSFTNVQFEIGTTATAYAPYIEDISTVKVTVGDGGTVSKQYDVNADGSVDGVTSIYPSMTLSTDTVGAAIDCTYNRDINKAFEALYNAIISMGGNV